MVVQSHRLHTLTTSGLSSNFWWVQKGYMAHPIWKYSESKYFVFLNFGLQMAGACFTREVFPLLKKELFFNSAARKKMQILVKNILNMSSLILWSTFSFLDSVHFRYLSGIILNYFQEKLILHFHIIFFLALWTPTLWICCHISISLEHLIAPTLEQDCRSSNNNKSTSRIYILKFN